MTLIVDRTDLSLSLFCSISVLRHTDNINYITPITRHWHANNLPSTEQSTTDQRERKKYIISLSFFIVYQPFKLLFKCRIVALKKRISLKNLHIGCVSVIINKRYLVQTTLTLIVQPSYLYNMVQPNGFSSKLVGLQSCV